MKLKAIFVTMLTTTLFACTAAQKQQINEDAQEVGTAAKETTTAIGHATRDATKETGHFFRDLTKKIFD